TRSGGAFSRRRARFDALGVGGITSFVRPVFVSLTSLGPIRTTRNGCRVGAFGSFSNTLLRPDDTEPGLARLRSAGELVDEVADRPPAARELPARSARVDARAVGNGVVAPAC